jgi:hypothetical protein
MRFRESICGSGLGEPVTKKVLELKNFVYKTNVVSCKNTHPLDSRGSEPPLPRTACKLAPAPGSSRRRPRLRPARLAFSSANTPGQKVFAGSQPAPRGGESRRRRYGKLVVAVTAHRSNTTAVHHRAANTMQSHLKPSSKKITPPGSLLTNQPLTLRDTGAKLSRASRKSFILSRSGRT